MRQTQKRRIQAPKREKYKIRMAEIICETIEEWDRLPSEELLCSELGIRKDIVKRCLKELEGKNDVFGYGKSGLYSLIKTDNRRPIGRYYFLSSGRDTYRREYRYAFGEKGDEDRCCWEPDGYMMAGAGIQEDDTVIIDLWQMPREGRPALVYLNGSANIWNVRHHDDGSVYLTSAPKEPVISKKHEILYESRFRTKDSRYGGLKVPVRDLLLKDPGTGRVYKERLISYPEVFEITEKDDFEILGKVWKVLKPGNGLSYKDNRIRKHVLMESFMSSYERSRAEATKGESK